MNPLFPKKEYDSAYAVPYEKLYAEGIRGIVFDIDNTLVLPDAPSDLRSRELFRRLHETGFRTCLVSNNSERRVAPFADAVDSLYVYKAGKPFRRGFLKALCLMKTERKNTVSVGDQLFTDIWGSNRAGITPFLVKPMTKKEEIQIILKRILEKPFLFIYHSTREKNR